MIKLITCTGFYGTGSSIVTDLLKEFDNCYSLGDYEIRFVQDPDGISDLEYNLVENNHRHNSGYSLKKYEKLVKFLSGNKFIKKYEYFFDNAFYSESKKYIESLKILEWNGMWHEDVRARGKAFYFLERLTNKIISRIYKSVLKKNERGFTFLKNEKTYLSNPKDKFYINTKIYMNNLFKKANKLSREFLVVDQLVPPSNIDRYMNYFDNLKVVVVDRDPRDCYILEKMVWKGTIVPNNNVEDFIIWYKEVRDFKKEEKFKNNVLRISFEEAVYEYEYTLHKILNFLKINKQNHKEKMKFFNPEISKKNTKLWVKYPELKKDIEKIELELKEYCWKY
ncbi:MAG: hypothetical protein ACRC7H_00770 [Plesiomonas shigelloides]